MTTNPNTIATNGQHLLDAIDSWLAGGDSTDVLAAADVIRAANDPANPVARAETELAAAARRAVIVNDLSALDELQDELQVSNRIVHDANVAAFHRWLDSMNPATLTVREIDLAAQIGRDLRSRPG